MQEFPHRYHATAVARDEVVDVGSPGLEGLETAPPAEFGGPGDKWSPETLLTAAIANCFILTFKAVARASKLEWNAIECDVEAVLDRVDRVTLFTQAHLKVKLSIDDEDDSERAKKLLEKSEANCLISNSLKTELHLDSEILVTA
ncbi:MAG: OsmC family protein [Pseudomonadales bacterium]|nr:OsmC family protein [Pseudomonadales bacterium]